MERTTRVVFGAMTGTSLDGLDLAAINWPIAAGERPCLLGIESGELGRSQAVLSKLASGQSCSAEEVARAAHDLAEIHIAPIARLAERVGQPELIAIHGQTVFHDPPRSWQLINPWPIASTFGVPVVSDLRGLDLATGGEGAPITPLSDLIWFGDEHEYRIVLNLGGFANASVLPPGGNAATVRGFDICACNHVLNSAARRALDQPFDRGGAAALRGLTNRGVVERIAQQLRLQAQSNRSLGSVADADVLPQDVAELSGEDLLASVAEAVGCVIGEAVRRESPDRVICAGGGARNEAVLKHISAVCEAEIVLSDEMGMPIEAREAAAIATLGALAADGQSITLPGVTGRDDARRMIDGLWCLQRGAADVSGI